MDNNIVAESTEFHWIKTSNNNWSKYSIDGCCFKWLDVEIMEFKAGVGSSGQVVQEQLITEAIVCTAAKLNMQNLVHIDRSPPDFHDFFFP